MRNKKAHFMGWALIVIGLAILLSSLGIIQISYFILLLKYWPIILIIIGLAMIFRMKWIANILGLLLIFGLTLSLIAPHSNSAESIEINESVYSSKEIKSANLELEYGAGNIMIGQDENTKILDYSIKTNNNSLPKIDYDIIGSKLDFKIQKSKIKSDLIDTADDSWTIFLSDEITYDIDLKYGAVNSNIDLSELKVKELSIDSGACKSEIKFGNYPTTVEINTGASSNIFTFPKNIGVKIIFDGGLSSTDFDGFLKTGHEYTTENYEESQDHIEIKISAGLASFNSEFY